MKIKDMIQEMTLEEKASLCSGSDWWHTKTIERLGLKEVMVSDGPHGLRKQIEKQDNVLGENVIKAVCFPTASALACSFDTELLHKAGEAIGDECQAEDVAVILGPGVNMKRSPLCGRNFEYYSEDPYLAGEMAAAFVNGIQSKNVGTSVKHFAANNQESRRFGISAKVDERTLREIYFPAFEKVVKKAQPWTIMCSYNQINGTYSSENDWLLNQVLREEWGYEGLVVSDWGAVNDRVKGVAAGLDLEMPSSKGVRDAQLVQAVKDGRLDEKVLDQVCERVLKLVERHYTGKKENVAFDYEGHHALVREIETECAVLLKNEDAILPLDKEQKVVLIGGYAKQPRFQGGGSSHINCSKVSAAVEEATCEFVLGFEPEQVEVEETLLAEAVEAAKKAKVAVIFAGLPESYETEGCDRRHMEMPPCQNQLIHEVAKVQPNTIVVLHNGSPISMPWKDEVKGILEMYLGGQAVGVATMDLLYGKKNPCGKLAETFPLRIQDNPSYLNFPGDKKEVDYAEGIYIGYRYYDKKELPVLFPFGYGLSYTSFEYSNLSVQKVGSGVEVTLDVKNTGECFGKEIVQVYVHQIASKVNRPEKELKGFTKVALEPGEVKKVSISLDERAFAYYDVKSHSFHVDHDTFVIQVGKSSREIVLQQEILLEANYKEEFRIEENTFLGEVIEELGSVDALIDGLKKYVGVVDEFFDDKELFRMISWELPIHSTCSFFPFPVSDEMILEILSDAKKNKKTSL